MGPVFRSTSEGSPWNDARFGLHNRLRARAARQSGALPPARTHHFALFNPAALGCFYTPPGIEPRFPQSEIP